MNIPVMLHSKLKISTENHSVDIRKTKYSQVSEDFVTNEGRWLEGHHSRTAAYLLFKYLQNKMNMLQKMHCIGHMRSFPKVARSQRTANTVLFAFCRPFISISTDPSSDCRSNGFWTKHELDLKFRQMEDK